MEGYHDVYVKLKDLPSFSGLNQEVQKVVQRSSWWDLYGVEWAHISGALLVSLGCMALLRTEYVLVQLLATFILGSCFIVYTDKAGHLAAHGALARSPTWNKFWTYVFIEFFGSYSEYMGNLYHIKIHHPHTNIIGLGDSSSWKTPAIPATLYMCLAPLLIPAITVPIAIYQLCTEAQNRWFQLVRYLLVMTAGYAFNIWLLMGISKFTFWGSVAFIPVYRAVLKVPYIHINIFQHIGLPMFSPDHRPPRVYQMSMGVLNLSPNLLLDWTFSYTLARCHIEHHFFPKLSDNMCMKIKPLVKDYLQKNGLPYQEKPYSERFWVFLQKYEELMVHAPPITRFVGLQ